VESPPCSTHHRRHGNAREGGQGDFVGEELKGREKVSKKIKLLSSINRSSHRNGLTSLSGTGPDEIKIKAYLNGRKAILRKGGSLIVNVTHKDCREEVREEKGRYGGRDSSGAQEGQNKRIHKGAPRSPEIDTVSNRGKKGEDQKKKKKQGTRSATFHPTSWNVRGMTEKTEGARLSFG